MLIHRYLWSVIFKNRLIIMRFRIVEIDMFTGRQRSNVSCRCGKPNHIGLIKLTTCIAALFATMLLTACSDKTGTLSFQTSDEDVTAYHSHLSELRKEDKVTMQQLVAIVNEWRVLDDSVSNTQNNATRFIIVTNKKICAKSANKVSICFEIAHESGSLYHMLSHFIYNNINMTNIQSRPIKGKNWEYRFFVDFEGRLEDIGVINALRGIKEEATALKILGTY